MTPNLQMLVDGVPVDTCANLTIVAGYEAHRAHASGEKGVKVGWRDPCKNCFRCTTTYLGMMCH